MKTGVLPVFSTRIKNYKKWKCSISIVQGCGVAIKGIVTLTLNILKFPRYTSVSSRTSWWCHLVIK